MLHKNFLFRLLFSLILIACVTGCEKFVALDPPKDRVTNESVFSTDVLSIGVMAGVYYDVGRTYYDQYASIPAYSYILGSTADDLRTLDGNVHPYVLPYYTNDLTASPGLGSDMDIWSVNYTDIYKCNDVINGVGPSKTLTPAIKQQLLAEAKFMRALFYFYMVNLYGDVPLILTTDYETNRLMGRTAKKDVYDQIVKDLNEAKDQLSASYLDGTLLKTSTARIRPTKWAATALLARVYLYLGNNAQAEAQASEVIDNTATFNLLPVDSSFLANNREAIFQSQNSFTGYPNTAEGRVLLLESTGPALDNWNPFFLNMDLVNSFEPGDIRRTNWINSVTVKVDDADVTYYYPYKYRNRSRGGVTGTENSTILRLAEQYLIRAEARILQGTKVAQGIEDLNTLRSFRRAAPTVAVPDPLPAYSTNMTQQAAVDAVAHERRVELFTESGHRWLDIKRTGKVDEVMNAAAKRIPWRSFQQYFPVPKYDIDRNPTLATQQNPGY